VRAQKGIEIDLDNATANRYCVRKSNVSTNDGLRIQYDRVSQ
jgi:hypothetical protein